MTSSARTGQGLLLLDANVLSRLALIGKADLLLTIFPNRCAIAPAIRHEIEAGIEAGITYLLPVDALVKRGDVQVLDLQDEDQQFIASVPRKLARGEAECIALCKRLGMVFVTHDRKAANYCERSGVGCLHFGTLVETLHQRGLLSAEEAQRTLA